MTFRRRIRSYPAHSSAFRHIGDHHIAFGAPNGMSTSRSVWICHRREVLGADPVTAPECWSGGPVTVTARTMPSGMDDQMSGVVPRSGVVAREGRAA